MTHLRTIDNSLLETINEVLESIFGKKSRIIIVETMEKKYFLKRSRIGEKLHVFEDVLRQMFQSGSLIIEDLILEKLYAKLNLEFTSQEGYQFSDYIQELREITL
jgi:hypothetical protein